MAIAVNSIVALSNNSAAQQSGVAPSFGRVIGGADPWNVLWDSGLVSTGLAGTSLNEITPQAVDPAIVRFIRAAGQQSGYYDCLIVAAYARDSVAYKLLRTVNAPQYFEAQATQIEQVSGR